MERNEVTKETIIEININVILEYYMWYTEKSKITYSIKRKWEVDTFSESQIFATKEDLLASL
jgi:hypothetical protein